VNRCSENSSQRVVKPSFLVNTNEVPKAQVLKRLLLRYYSRENLVLSSHPHRKPTIKKRHKKRVKAEALTLKLKTI